MGNNQQPLTPTLGDSRSLPNSLSLEATVRDSALREQSMHRAPSSLHFDAPQSESALSETPKQEMPKLETMEQRVATANLKLQSRKEGRDTIAATVTLAVRAKSVDGEQLLKEAIGFGQQTQIPKPDATRALFDSLNSALATAAVNHDRVGVEQILVAMAVVYRSDRAQFVNSLSVFNTYEKNLSYVHASSLGGLNNDAQSATQILASASSEIRQRQLARTEVESERRDQQLSIDSMIRERQSAEKAILEQIRESRRAARRAA